jgi:hypothetical protein
MALLRYLDLSRLIVIPKTRNNTTSISASSAR